MIHKNMNMKRLLTLVSILLVIMLVANTVSPCAASAAADENSELPEYTAFEEYTEPEYEYSDIDEDMIEPPIRKKESVELAATGAWDGTTVYGDGVIYIANYNQLSQIGSNTEVKDTDTNSSTFGQGNPIHLSGSGTEEDPYVNLTYSNDATYYLTNDIPLPSRTAWSVPAGFTGMFTSEDANGEDNSVLRTTDTNLYEVVTATRGKVYYHNVFAIAENENAVIHANDYDVLNYGTGGSINHLYRSEHAYYIDSSFTAQTTFDVTEYITVTDDQNSNVQAIVIRNYDQLELVGLGEQTLKTDTINGITRTQTVNYPPDAAYYLNNDIELADNGWQLPSDFTGSFTCDPNNKQADSQRLYVSHTTGADVFIQNIYQLEILGLDDNTRSEEPVLSQDYDAAYVGAGTPIYLTNLSTDYLTYEKASTIGNSYILSRTFSNARVDQVSTTALGMISNSDHIDGRDWFGQTTVEIDGTTYILIGDRQQLDAIGTDKYVYGPVYAVTQRRNSILDTWQIDDTAISLVYPGDADLIADVAVNPDGTSVQDFSESPLFSTSTAPYHTLGTVRNGTYERVVYCASDGSGGYNVRATTANANRGTQRYTKDANYIVFRDINMLKTDQQDKNWQPLMFSGTMYGDKAASSTDVSTLWNNGKTALNIVEERKPVISNIAVVPATLTQDGKTKLDITEQTGIGFFGTLEGNFNSSTYISDPVIVKNIKLKDGTVNNPAVSAGYDRTLINGTLTFLATALGTILDPVLQGLIGDGSTIGVESMLTGLLNARAQDPNSVATGAFAGRVMSDSTVEDCEVENISVTTVLTDYERNGKIVGKGGFVGHTEGETTYSGLSNVLGAVGTALSRVLNVIPGLGLGDLITVLLDNALPLGQLIPTGYTAPRITDCTVNNCTLSTEDGKYGVGGFAGSTCGTIITDCAVKNCDDLEINADHFGGGFAGISRDAMIKGTLSGLDINIAEALCPQSELINCSIEDSDITVRGHNYLGGFVGSLADSYSINDTIDSDSSITVTGINDGTDEDGDCVGGFVGRAQLGSLFGMGEYLKDSADLLGAVTRVVTGLLGTGGDQALLDLGGVAPSAVMGCVIDAPLTVSSGGSYVGGIIGRGDGVYLTRSSEENLRKLAKYKPRTQNSTLKPLPIASNEARDNTVTDLISVSAGEDFAGGIAGYLTSANVGGLLGSTLGIGQYLGFTVSDTTVIGTSGDPDDDDDDGYTVSTVNDFAGGGIGWAVGGDIIDTQLFELRSVTAHNRAGGFVGATGPGDLVSGEGIDLTLLGVSLLSIDNLLSLVSGVRTTYTRADVTGIDAGFTVSQTGTRAGDAGGVQDSFYTAGGFAAEANSVTVRDSFVSKLKSVTANDAEGVAGGFVAHSAAGGLAGVVEENDTLDIAKVNGLLGAVPYLIPHYDGCSVTYVDGGYVRGDTAGGFAGDFQSGYVNTETIDENAGENDDPYEYENGHSYTVGTPDNPFSVYNISYVQGQTYAGGFGGKVYAGSLASAGGGVSILSDHAGNNTLNIAQLLSLVNAYVPTISYAGVHTPDGFTVEAKRVADGNRYSGSAGGFIGYASGAQISFSDVYRLKNTQVVPPDDLEADSAPSYYPDNSQSSYAVRGGRYAGGYMGAMDLGDAASVGGGISAVGKSLINLNDVVSVLNVVVTTVEHSDVEGAAGGFSVFSDGTDSTGKVGMSGGYVGGVEGGHIQNSHCKNFYYIVGQEAAGGYAGTIQPGSVARLLEGQSDLLSGLLGTNSVLASLLSTFVPTIRNSTTSCVPCGGAVRADSPSDTAYQRGCAGGYCGHNIGGQIWGNNSDTWKDQNDGIRPISGEQSNDPKIGNYTGEKHEAAAYRIRSVYGREYAGGFTGFMESANLADTGSVSLLYGLITASNVLGALKAVYPTEKNTAVYGPLRNLDWRTWNAWVTYVGKNGGYGAELAREGKIIVPENPTEEELRQAQAQLDARLSKYIYGYNVVAGRSAHVVNLITEGGNAGGYVGYMLSGVIENGQAYDAKLIRSMRSTGGYAGKMQTGGLAEVGGVNILGLNLDLGTLVNNIGSVFVPTIKSGSVHGYQSGMTVTCTGTDFVHNCGYAGGYVGSAYGAQIWGDKSVDDAPGTGCNVYNLRYVRGRNATGGYVGLSTAAAAANVNTNASEGFLQGVLNTLISTPSDLASVLQATATTIRDAEVDPDDDAFGFIVEGLSGTPPRFGGGFAGSFEATVINDLKHPHTVTVNGLRRVDGLYYSGGFVGLADVGSVASVSNSGQNSTTILALINAGSVDLLDVFRTYIYDSDVNGVADGFTVHAYSADSEGILSESRYSGCAGGFAGGMMNGTIKRSDVTNLNTVEGVTYTGGFIGHAGKNGIVDVDDAVITGLLGATAGVLDIFGTVIDDCDVSGISQGIVVSSAGGAAHIPGNNQPSAMAGGYAGYADISQIKNSNLTNLKQVYSAETAGGFVGKTDMHYLVEAEVSSGLVQIVLFIVNELVKALYVPQLERVNLINIGSGSNLLGLKLLSEGDLLYVNLLGLRIGVSLAKASDTGNATDTAIITIGDSTIELPCSEDGIDFNNENPEVVVNLIKGNRTKVENCSVHGVPAGYDVYGGGAGNDQDGSGTNGYAGGFVGYNDEGKLTENVMEYCDVVRGTANKVGPFSGTTHLKSVYSFNTLQSIEAVSGEENQYSVYRQADPSLVYALTDSNQRIGNTAVQDTGTPITYNRYDVIHLASPLSPDGVDGNYHTGYDKWEDAVIASDASGAGSVPIEVYESSAKAVLMRDTPTSPNDQSLIPEPGESQDPCDLISLTIQKVWDDWDDHDGIRPSSIRIRIWQWQTYQNGNIRDGTDVLYIDSAVIPDIDTTDGWFTLTEQDHALSGSATWRRVIEGLPVSTVINDRTVYYAYTVEEEAVAGYDTQIAYSADGFTATITNKYVRCCPLRAALATGC